MKIPSLHRVWFESLGLTAEVLMMANKFALIRAFSKVFVVSGVMGKVTRPFNAETCS